MVYVLFLKTASLNNAVREFSLAYQSWVMTHYTMLYKYGKSARDFLRRFHFYFRLVFYILGGVFNQTIISLMLVGYEMIIANSYPTRPSEIIAKGQVGKLYAGACILQGAVAEHFKQYIS